MTVVRLEAPVLMWIKYEDIHLANLWQLPSPFICIFWNTMHKLHFYRKYNLRLEIKLARAITLHDTITTFNDILKKDMLGKNECGLMKQYSGCFIQKNYIKNTRNCWLSKDVIKPIRISYKHLQNLFANVLVNYISIHS